MSAAATLKIEKSPYLGRILTDFDQILHGDAVRPSSADRLCRHRSKSVPETMTHVTGFCWYQKLVLETGQCVMGLSDYKTSAG